MTNQQVMVITNALHGSDQKSLASKFNSGRFDKDMKWAAERSFAEQAIMKNEKLQICSAESIQGAILDVAYTGLSLSPTLAHGYLIPYGKTCTFAPGYRGLLHMAFKAGSIASVQVNLAHRNDPTFRVWTDEHGRHIQHEENMGKRGDVTHAYCICRLANSSAPIIEVMDRAQLDAVRKQAERKPGGGMVWRGPFAEEMMKKAVIRRASKLWPKDNGGLIDHMMTVSDRYDPVDFAPDPDQPPAEAELCMSEDHYTALYDLLLNRGISPQDAPEWLRRWAQSRGYASFEDAPARLYDEAKQIMEARLDDRAARVSAGQNAPDNQ